MRSWCGAMLTALIPAVALAGTAHVPADYPTIQAALDVSSVGDTVLVAPGTYSDYTISGGVTAEVAVLPDGVVLKSEGGASATTIDLAPLEGAASSSAAFGCGGHVSGLTVIDGFRVTGFPPVSGGAAIGSCARVEVRNCIFEVEDPPEPSAYRVGIATLLSDVHVINCSFIRCSANSGAGISQVGGPVRVEGCSFIECRNQGIRAIEGGGAGPHSLEVRDCLFQDVSGMSGGGCISTLDLVDGVLVDGCRFEAPEVVGSRGAALGLAGWGVKTISNNVFQDMSLSNGASCIKLQYGTGIIRGNTFAYLADLVGHDGVALFALSVTTVTFENNIVAHTAGGSALSFETTGPVTGACNVFWDNPEGLGYTLRPSDRIVDPLFCDGDARDLTLHGSSPCLPASSLGCGLIGALGQGCGTVGVDAQSWGKTKSAYRSEEE